MRRFSSFRDFDWTLLILVMLISVISVLEIKSATLHTKFHGFGENQIKFLLLGIVLIAVSLFMQRGLWGLGERIWQALRRDRPTDADNDTGNSADNHATRERV